MTIKLAACVLHAGYLRQQTHTQNVKYLWNITFHGNNGYANAPQCYATHTLPVYVFPAVRNNKNPVVVWHTRYECNQKLGTDVNSLCS